MKYSHLSSHLLSTTLLYICLSFPALAQEGNRGSEGEMLVLEEVIVTARRREEAIQDVPVSMTVFNQRQLDDANIVNSGDLATYTPSLQANTRFGADTTTFAIRGFAQELRTTASVGVYFAEVVAPRGANSQQSGDGAGPGDFFDLQNVQVLKGPQGTLFGRNTTGGAILLTPTRPGDELGGYIEASAGNYGMWRAQGVLNVPAGDSVALRFGLDHQERDGYIDNVSDIGPEEFADVDYTAVRASAVIEITDALENYTIFRWYESENNGYPGSLIDCNDAEPLGALFCQPDLDARVAAGQNDFFDIYNFVDDPKSEQEQWQLINTTTWDIGENLTARNILSYAHLETRLRSAIFGTNWRAPPGNPDGQPFIFQQVGLNDSRNTTDQNSLVWELQFQGTAFDDELTWQGGVYYENSEPEDDYGAQSPTFVACDQATITSNDPNDFRCNQQLSAGVGGLVSAAGGVEYTNQAVYMQGTYDFNEQLSASAGIRYTDDETEGEVEEITYKFPSVAAGGLFPIEADRTDFDYRTPEQESDEFTWLLGVDYKPNEDVLLYAKYARGYRQGSVNVGGLTGLDTHGPEEVDTYEIGAKTSFRGRIPAFFNVSAHYNDFQDQQIQYGYFKPSGTGTTAILNAGASTIWGVEVETTVQLHENFVLRASYAYLDTEVDELVLPELPPDIPVGLDTLNTTTSEGEPLSFAPENELVLTGTFYLPVSASLGEMSFSASYIYIDEMQATSQESSIYAVLDDRTLLNLNFNWTGIAGSPVDLSVFGTNVTDEEYLSYISGLWVNGIESGQAGLPRMYGARIRYHFGN